MAEPSPAEAYASFRSRQATPALAAFADGYGFAFDDYQREACAHVEAGSGVLVAAPTGAGKTIVGEFAVFLALEQGRKCFYTTPIKALSNQKYADLVKRHGADQVGLLTGDSTINSEAPVVVMTTEVLRNMIYAGSSTLANLGFVVMDEVHYLADRFRGAVWEEVIIGLAESIQVVALSATVSNAEEFGEWLAEVRGEMAVVVSERRPVPLFQHVLVGTRLYDLFADVAPTAREAPGGRTDVNPALLKVAREESRLVRDDSRRPRGAGGRGSAQRRLRQRGVRRSQPGQRRLRPQRRPAAVVLRAEPARHRRAAGAGGVAAGDHLHLLPGRLRRRRTPDARLRPAADHRRRARRDRPDHRPAHRRPLAPPTWPRWTTTGSSRRWSAASPPTTPGCCRRSRSAWRRPSSAAWSRWSSPPRPWRWASTCRPGRWSWRSWSSTTARPTPTSRRGSTPS